MGVLDSRHVLVTLKTDPTPGTVDVVALDTDGAVEGTGELTALGSPVTLGVTNANGVAIMVASKA